MRFNKLEWTLTYISDRSTHKGLNGAASKCGLCKPRLGNGFDEWARFPSKTETPNRLARGPSRCTPNTMPAVARAELHSGTSSSQRLIRLFRPGTKADSVRAECWTFTDYKHLRCRGPTVSSTCWIHFSIQWKWLRLSQHKNSNIWGIM